MIKFWIILLSFGVEPSASLHDDFEGSYAQCREAAHIETFRKDDPNAYFVCVRVGDNY